MDVIARATLLGGYRALPSKDIFDVEYWDLEQAKLKKGGKPAAFAGEIALVTGAASGIGKACVDALLSRGAAVVGLDLNPSITGMYQRPDFLGIACDVGSESQLRNALQRAADAFGGLDMLVLNAGIFPAGCRVESLASDQWRRVMQINVEANFHLMREAHPYLRLAPRGGRVVIVGSKNVAAPGPGAAAYSASKGGIVGMTLPMARDLAGYGIRVMSIMPGLFETPMMAAVPDDFRHALEASIPFPSRLGKLGEYAQLARSIIENDMLNGTAIRLDGALRMQPK
jgi:NAD(P)-dependent dehydrogenase (short-subunit alcohol dehydrogenase family)